MIRFRRLTSFEQLRRFSSFPRSQPSRCHLLRYHSNAIKQETALSTWNTNTNTEYWHYVHNGACDSVVLFKSRKWICHLSLLQIKPNQAKVLTGSGDLRFAQVDFPLSGVDKKNQLDVTFVFFISLLIVAQHVSGNHVPIIRS